MQILTDDEMKKRGDQIAKVFNLKRDKHHKDRYITDFGTKTAIGVYLVSKRLIENGE